MTFAAIVAIVWSVVITLIWLKIGYRAMQAHERIAAELQKLAQVYAEQGSQAGEH